MAKERGPGKSSGDGCPKESAELSGKIITAAVSTMTAHSFEKGYPEVEGRLKMDNIGGKRR
jgi:hypothetical protein